jgi:putative NADPH-quinone reductase
MKILPWGCRLTAQMDVKAILNIDRELIKEVNLLQTSITSTIGRNFNETQLATSRFMGKFLLLVVHPDAGGESTSHRIAKAANDALVAAGNEVRIVDLIQTPFNQCASAADFISVPPGRLLYQANQKPDNLILAIREQQATLEWSTHVVVIGPIWFYRYPAAFYAWVDRVWTFGWADDFTKKHEELTLFGRKAPLVITTGAPGEVYSHGGPLTSIDALLYATTSVFGSFGFTVYRTQGVWLAGKGNEAANADQIEKAAKAILNIGKRPVLPFRGPANAQRPDDVEVFAKLPNIEFYEAANLQTR